MTQKTPDNDNDQKRRPYGNLLMWKETKELLMWISALNQQRLHGRWPLIATIDHVVREYYRSVYPDTAMPEAAQPISEPFNKEQASDDKDDNDSRGPDSP